MIAGAGVVLGLLCMLISRRLKLYKSRKSMKKQRGDAMPHPRDHASSLTEASGADTSAHDGGINQAEQGVAAENWRSLTKVSTSHLQVSQSLLGPETTWDCAETRMSKKLSMGATTI